MKCVGHATFMVVWGNFTATATTGCTICALSEEQTGRCDSWSQAFDVRCSQPAGHVGLHVASDDNNIAIAEWESVHGGPRR